MDILFLFLKLLFLSLILLETQKPEQSFNAVATPPPQQQIKNCEEY